MWVELFSCLLLAHLVADFVFQTQSFCDRKNEKHWRSGLQYIHALIVFSLTWLVSWNLSFWWCALIIGATHLCIDIWKSYRPKKVVWFVADQLLHVCVLAIVAWLWGQNHAWSLPWGIEMKHVAVLAALLICWKPANLFIKGMLTQYSSMMVFPFAFASLAIAIAMPSEFPFLGDPSNTTVDAICIISK